MTSTDIKWSCIAAEDPFYPIAENQTTTLYIAWPEDGSADAAKAVAEDYFNQDDLWVEWFGEDDRATVRIIITHPEAAAGTYEVSMERVVRAQARLLP